MKKPRLGGRAARAWLRAVRDGALTRESWAAAGTPAHQERVWCPYQAVMDLVLRQMETFADEWSPEQGN